MNKEDLVFDKKEVAKALALISDLILIDYPVLFQDWVSVRDSIAFSETYSCFDEHTKYRKVKGERCFWCRKIFKKIKNHRCKVHRASRL